MPLRPAPAAMPPPIESPQNDGRAPVAGPPHASRASRTAWWGLAFLALAVTAGCSPRRLAESVLLSDRFVRTADVAYGPQARQRLDVYRPRTLPRGAPVVVFLYGGRWQYGSKDDYRLLGDVLTRSGFVVVVPDYRLHPDTVFPGGVHDAARAVRWARDHAAEYGGDSSRLVLVGHSAGAHSAALLALDPRYMAEAGVPRTAIRGAVVIAGPVDTTWTDPDVQRLMGPREHWPASYPARFVGADDPPILLQHGGGDRTVQPRNSTGLAERLTAAGGCARAVVYPRLGHVEIVVALAAPWLRDEGVLGDLVAFVRDPAGTTCPGARTARSTRPSSGSG